MTALTNEEFMDALWDTFVEVDGNMPPVMFVYRDDDTLAAVEGIEPVLAAKAAPMALVGFRADEVTFVVDSYTWTGPDHDIPNGTPSEAFMAGDPHASEGLMFQRCFQDGSCQAGHISYRRDDTQIIKTSTRTFKAPLSGRLAVDQEKMALVKESWELLYRASDRLQLSSLAADMICAKVMARDLGIEFTLYYSADDDEQRDEAIAEAERMAAEFNVNAQVRAIPDEAP
jgi:hypothetical protein